MRFAGELTAKCILPMHGRKGVGDEVKMFHEGWILIKNQPLLGMGLAQTAIK
jgi:hypothetical protein